MTVPHVLRSIAGDVKITRSFQPFCFLCMIVCEIFLVCSVSVDEGSPLVYMCVFSLVKFWLCTLSLDDESSC